MNWESRISSPCTLLGTLLLCVYISCVYFPAEISRNVDTWSQLFYWITIGVTLGAVRNSSWWAGTCSGSRNSGVLHWPTSKPLFMPLCPSSYICYTDGLPTFFLSLHTSAFFPPKILPLHLCRIQATDEYTIQAMQWHQPCHQVWFNLKIHCC